MPTALRLLIAAVFGSVALALSAICCVLWSIPLMQGELFLRAVLFTTMLAFVVSDIFWLTSSTSLGALYAACFGSALAFGVFALSAFIFYTSATIFNFDSFVLFKAGGWLVLPSGALTGLSTWVWLRSSKRSLH